MNPVHNFELTRVVQFGNVVPGVFSPVLAKHSKHFALEDSLSVGVDRMQRNFEPMQRQVETWRAQQLSTATAKLTIYVPSSKAN